MKFLRFENKSAARAAFAPWIIEGEWPAYIGNVAVDVVGVIRKLVGEPDEHGNQEFETLPGFHVNLSGPVPELADFEIEPPATPARVFAGWVPDQPEPVPAEVPRYCGVLALKRHRLADDELEALGEEEGWESGSLYAQLLAFRDGLPSGALRDKLDVAIDHVMHWTLESPTVTEMCAVMGLSTAHRDALFRWAKAHEATL